eukprot:GHVU01174653.1.p1 GENE.GHVU01174653.1~~GHVU01174653.1.p1  ORF type:complete len:117 (+),score=7.29 GHVU01174653.1:355-705(+)
MALIERTAVLVSRHRVKDREHDAAGRERHDVFDIRLHCPHCGYSWYSQDGCDSCASTMALVQASVRGYDVEDLNDWCSTATLPVRAARSDTSTGACREGPLWGDCFLEGTMHAIIY